MCLRGAMNLRWIGPAAPRPNPISRTTSSRKNGGKTGAFRFSAGTSCAIEISIGGGNAFAACGAAFIFFASIMYWDFIGSMHSPGGHDATKNFPRSIGARCWNELADARRISPRTTIRPRKMARRRSEERRVGKEWREERGEYTRKGE